MCEQGLASETTLECLDFAVTVEREVFWKHNFLFKPKEIPGQLDVIDRKSNLRKHNSENWI